MSVVANVAINVDSRNAVSKLREVQSQSQLTERAVQGVTSAFASLTAAFGAGFAISKVVQDVKELDTNLRRLGTVGGDVAALDKGLGSLSRNLDGVASKAELAAASYQALSAGFTETGANLRLVEAATKAAVGGLVDVTSVVEVTTKTLNAYGMSGSRAAEVTDSISKAIEFGQVQWSDYTSQLGRVASIAAIAGVSLDEVNAFIAAATKNGATAEIAFTGLGATLNTLLQPTKESQEAAAALGIQWNLAGLNAKGFDGLLAELAKKQDTNKEAAARLLGSQEAMRGVFAANAKAGKDFQMILEGLQGAAGKTESDFNQMKGTLENQLKALDTAFKNLSEALGIVFGPAAIDAIGGVTDAVNGFADIIKTIPEPVGKGALEIGKLVAQVVLLQKAIQGIIALRLALIGMLTATATSAGTAATAASGLTMNMRYLQGSMVQANAAASPLLATLRSIAAIGVITVAVNLIVTGIQETLAAVAEVRRLRGERAAGGAAAIYSGSATEEQKAAARQTLTAARKEQQRYANIGTKVAQTLLGPLSQVVGVPTTAQATDRGMLLQERIRRAEAVMGLPTRAAAKVDVATPTVPTVTPPAPDTAAAAKKKPTGKSDAERAAERAAEQERQIQDRLKGLALETQALQQLGILRDAQLNAELTGNKELQNQLALEERIFDIRQGLAKELLGESDERIRIAKQTAAEEQVARAIADAMADTMKQEAERKKTLEDITRGLQDQIDLTGPLTDEQRRALEFEKQIAQWKRDGVVKTEEEIDALRKLNNELEKRQKFTTQQTITAGLNETKKQLGELTNLGNIVVNSANAIGDAFGQAFRSIASGAASAKEVLAEFFQNVANAFLDMAAQIIAKQVVMVTLQAILKALGGASGGAPGGEAFSVSPEGGGLWGGMSLGEMPAAGAFGSAQGNVFSPQGHVERYAQGGVVTAPTMFRFAKGSGFAPGLMGEAGPEAILPLQRTPSGDLGVRATLQVPYANAGNKDLQVPYTRAGEQYGIMAGDGMIRFESTVINNQEFVTKDEAERIGQAAASRGAEIAQRRMKNSPQVRRSLGIA